MELNTMTLEELEAHQQELNAQRAVLKEQAHAVQMVMDTKLAEAELTRKVATMSDAEKALLVQMVQAGGLPSSETVGVPGT